MTGTRMSKFGSKSRIFQYEIPIFLHKKPFFYVKNNSHFCQNALTKLEKFDKDLFTKVRLVLKAGRWSPSLEGDPSKWSVP